MVTINDIKMAHEFFVCNNFQFVLTGTSALSFYGLLPDNYKTDDIDVLVLTTNNDMEKIITELYKQEKLSGIKNPEYECQLLFSFFVNKSVKVNAIIVNTETVNINYTWYNYSGDKAIKLHLPCDILKAKFMLSRPKDYKFFADLQVKLHSFFKK